MKTHALTFSLLFLAGGTQAALYQIGETVNQLIPDGSATGLSSTIDITGQSGVVDNVTVNLNISGTYNGDLYAYLVNASGFAILLNRVGATSANPNGYSDSGLNVTFSDAAANNIHTYRQALSGNPNQPITGQLTGTWQPDGRAVSPYSVTGTEPSTALLSSFNGSDINGDWTLFVADVSGGDLNTLTSWGLNVDTVAAPESTGFGTTAGLLLVVYCVRQYRKTTSAPKEIGPS